MKKYSVYKAYFGCGCTQFTSRLKSDIYHVSKLLGVIPKQIVGFNTIIGPYYAMMIQKTKRGWKF